MLQRPSPGEYAAFYQRYLDRVPKGGDVIGMLEDQGAAAASLIEGLDDASNEPYAPGKWSLKQLTGHLLDTERVFAHRGLCISRNERAPLPGFNQDQYVREADSDSRSFASLADEMRVVRAGTLWLFRTLPPGAATRTGTANGGALSARAVPFIIAGHERHHLEIIREHYLGRSGS